MESLYFIVFDSVCCLPIVSAASVSTKSMTSCSLMLNFRVSLYKTGCYKFRNLVNKRMAAYTKIRHFALLILSNVRLRVFLSPLPLFFPTYFTLSARVRTCANVLGRMIDSINSQPLLLPARLPLFCQHCVAM